MSEQLDTLGGETLEVISGVSGRERGGTSELLGCLSTEEARVVHTLRRTEADDIDVLDIHVSAEDELSLAASHASEFLPPKRQKISLNLVPKEACTNQPVGSLPRVTSASRTRSHTSLPVRDMLRKSTKRTGVRAPSESSLSVPTDRSTSLSPLDKQYMTTSSEEYFRHHPVQNRRKKRILQIPRGNNIRPLMSLSATGWGFQQYPPVNASQVPLPPMYP
jgi:hypothetical protein